MKITLLPWSLLCSSFLLGLSLKANMLDSLRAELARSGSDTHKVSLHCKLAWEMRRTDAQGALLELERAEELADKTAFSAGKCRVFLYRGVIDTEAARFEKADAELQRAKQCYTAIKDVNGVGKSWNKLGILNFYQGKLKEALGHFERALEYFTDARGRASTHNNMALAYQALGDMDAYLENMLAARTAMEAAGDLKSVALLLGNLGSYYRELEDYNQALSYYLEAAAVLPEGGDVEVQVSNQVNLALAYEKMGEDAKAVGAYQTAVALARSGGFALEEGLALNNLANYYEEKKEYEKALSRYEEALDLFEQIGRVKFQAAVVSNLGALAERMGKRDTARRYLHRSVELALESGDVPRIAEVYENLASFYEADGNAEQALRYQKLYGQMRDSLLDAEELKRIVALEIEYEAAAREMELVEAKGEVERMESTNSWLWLAVLGLAVVLLGAAVLVLVQRRAIMHLRQDHFDVAVAYAEIKGRLEEKETAVSQEASAPQVGGPGLPPEFETLSKREIEVFLCLANGMANKAVAEELSISVDTVRTHVKNIYAKLGLRNRAMVMKLAHEYGMA